jgi:hypothetical protein
MPTVERCCHHAGEAHAEMGATLNAADPCRQEIDMDEDEDVVEGEVGGAEVEGAPVRRVQERLVCKCAAVVAGLRPLPQLEP